MNKNIENLTKIFLFMFILLVIMNSYWSVWREKEISSMEQNPRVRENLALRGGFISGTGEYLAKSIKKNKEIIRDYPEGQITGNTVGYLDVKLGKSGLEYSCNDLLKSRPFPLTAEGFKERWNEGHPKGYNIFLTLDMKLSKIAYEALGNSKGAVVAIEPSTGKILVMVSSPGFDANQAGKKWDLYRKDPSSPLLDRTIQGQYPPGSIFKVLVLAAALEEGIVNENDSFYCNGSIDVEGHAFNCTHVHGSQDLKRAMANSCNSAFASIGLKLGKEKLINYFKEFFPSEYDFGLPALHSKLTEKNLPTNALLAQTSFGQGELLLTPFEACLMVCAIANKGTIMYPHIIKEIRDSKNRLIEEKHPQVLAKPVSPDTASKVALMMEAVVDEGTGYLSQIEGIKVGGKTGTAEQPGGEPHAWFVGFAPVENPKIAIAVIVEGGGFGGEVAAPIARDIILKATRE